MKCIEIKSYLIKKFGKSSCVMKTFLRRLEKIYRLLKDIMLKDIMLILY